VLGAGTTLLLGLAVPADVVAGVRDMGEILLFLVSVMVLAGLAEHAGVFRWAAGLALRSARGRGWLLFVNLYLLGALVTLFLSLDVTAVVLTPLICALVVPLRLDARPFVFACAFVANTASLALPMSNLTNMLVYQILGLGLWDFVRFLALPNLAALAVGLLTLLCLFWHRLPGQIEVTTRGRRHWPGAPFFRWSLAILLLTVAGLLMAGLSGLPFWMVSLPATLLLSLVALGRRWIGPRAVLATVSWELPFFVVGMYVVVAAVYRAGAPALATVPGMLGALPGPLPLAGAVVVSTLGANAVNNLPFSLAAIQFLHDVPPAAATVDGQALQRVLAYGLLLGVNLGANLTVTGSLATMLCLASARRQGIRISGLDFLRAGVMITPPMLLAAGLVLWYLLAAGA
jgi:arsenical pump membrane protein